MVSARWLIKLPVNSVAFRYISEYQGVFLDSGGYGAAFYDDGFKFSIDEYAELVQKIRPEYWATMDYPCEPNVRQGMTVNKRIALTIKNCQKLLSVGLPGCVPVIQGWELNDYLLCVELMRKANVIQPVMGIGSICRRGKQAEIVEIVRHLHKELPQTQFHAFGVKINALKCNNGEILNYLHSIDTAAWQFNEKDEFGGWRPRTREEIDRRLKGYREKLGLRASGPYQLILTK